VRHLAAAGHPVHVIDLPSALSTGTVHGATSSHAASTEDAEGLAAAVASCRPAVVVDLAYLVGSPAEESISLATRANLMGPLNAMRATHEAGARRYVLASSIAVYGPSTELWGRAVTENDMLPLDQHETTYGAFKCVNEFQLASIAAETGLTASSVRLSIVMGASRRRGLATWPSHFLSEVGTGRRQHRIPVPSSGRCNLISTSDAVRLLHLVSVHPQPRAIYNSGGHELSARDLANLARRSHPGIEVAFDEHARNIPFVHAVDNTRARDHLGFSLQGAADLVGGFTKMV
jgi:nucleoside-diphosphate-sugar epimerase